MYLWTFDKPMILPSVAICARERKSTQLEARKAVPTVNTIHLVFFLLIIPSCHLLHRYLLFPPSVIYSTSSRYAPPNYLVSIMATKLLLELLIQIANILKDDGTPLAPCASLVDKFHWMPSTHD